MKRDLCRICGIFTVEFKGRPWHEIKTESDELRFASVDLHTPKPFNDGTYEKVMENMS